jgi:hypothetical protein
MERIYIFLIRNDVWIYILCTLALVWYLSEYLRSRRILRQAIFGLERERGERIRRRSLTVIILALAVVGLVTYVNLEVSPTLPAELLKPPTPTPDIFSAPLSSPTPLGGAPGNTATPVIAPTVTLRSSPTVDATAIIEQETLEPDETRVTEQPQPPTPPFVLGGCATNTNISAPPDGAEAGGRITFFGTANAEDFSEYLLEASGPQTEGRWVSLMSSGGTSPVFDGILGTVDLGGWSSGSYAVRLTVVDNAGEIAGQCTIQISIASTT